jgi:bacteriorhodopsin
MTSDHEGPQPPGEAEPMTMRQARMLDLRTYICGLFLIFGGVVTFLGISPPPDQLQRAAGININLWAGLAMLALALVMGSWALVVPPELPDQGEPTERNSV